MNRNTQQKLEELRADFAATVGRPFEHFYCPILFRDESTPLCQAHVVNQAFSGSDRAWTVQRADVDSFFGSAFESEFVLLQERGKHASAEVLADQNLSRKLKPKILVDGQEVPYYRNYGVTPTHHSKLVLEVGDRPQARIALKLSPSEMLAALERDWTIQVEQDVRLPALVSLLKAAHLTMFATVGYVYALSAGGHFLGSDILGKFFLANAGKKKTEILDNAREHFSEFANLVRPIVAAPPGLKGTITDGLLYICTGSSKPWGSIVLARTGESLHAVLVPVMEDADSAARFVSFLRKPPAEFEVKLAKFAGDRWEISPNPQTFRWPAANLED